MRNNSQFSILNSQFKRAITVFSVIIAFFTLTGCAGILEGNIETITPHEIAPYERPPVEYDTVSNLEGLREHLFELITAHESQTLIHYLGLDNADIQTQAQNISQEILQNNPVASYAVADITITATRMVSYFEMTIDIEFKRTAEQIGAIINASTERYMVTQMLEMMSGYREEAVFHTNVHLDKEAIEKQVAELYYQNPRRIVMMPIITVEAFPAAEETQIDPLDANLTEPDPAEKGETPDEESENTDRIYEIKFGYPEDTEILRGFGENLTTSVRQNAARADGDTDGEILLSLVQNLIAGAEYDEGTATAISMHGQQNIAATAFGALVRGSAVGEGFAMALKALCDWLDLDCRVVLGAMEDDRFHAWNVVLLDGDYYHIDAAMCAKNGLEAGFLKTDEDISEIYVWDKVNTPKCNGHLTLLDILPQEIIENDNPDNHNENPAGNERNEEE